MPFDTDDQTLPAALPPTEAQLKQIRAHIATVAAVATETKLPPTTVDAVLRSWMRQNGRPLYGEQP